MYRGRRDRGRPSICGNRDTRRTSVPCSRGARRAKPHTSRDALAEFRSGGARVTLRAAARPGARLARLLTALAELDAASPEAHPALARSSTCHADIALVGPPPHEVDHYVWGACRARRSWLRSRSGVGPSIGTRPELGTPLDACPAAVAAMTCDHAVQPDAEVSSAEADPADPVTCAAGTCLRVCRRARLDGKEVHAQSTASGPNRHGSIRTRSSEWTCRTT